MEEAKDYGVKPVPLCKEVCLEVRTVEHSLKIQTLERERGKSCNLDM